MSSYTKPLILKFIDGKMFEVYEPFEYHVEALNSGKRIKVPKGYKTNGASIPWYARWLLPRWGLYGKAAVLHDYMYDHPFIEVNPSLIRPTIELSRKEADDIFYEAMTVSEVKGWKKTLIYWAVRLAAHGAWQGT